MAHGRTARFGLHLLAAGALLAALVMAPATTQARTPDPLDHTTATRTATVEPRTMGVPRTASGGGALGVPTIAGGGAAALRALRRPGVTVPRRFHLPHWLPQRASRKTATSHATATAGRTLGSAAAGTPATATAATPVTPGEIGLRSEIGNFGLSDADDSLLYSDCSVFELCEEPPDPGVAVSATSVVEAVNELILVVDRATNGSRVMPNFDFFALDSNQVTQSDPRVLYDAVRHRWLATEISSDCGHGYLHMAISTTDDPFGTWTVYRVVFPNLVVDFPGVGTASGTVIVGLNAYAPDPKSPDCLAPGEFEGGMLAVIDWSDLTQTVASLSVTTTPPDPKLFTWRPAVGGDQLGRLVVAIDNGSDDTSDVGYATLSGSNATHDVTLSPVFNLTSERGVAPFATPPAPRQPGDPKTIEFAVDGQPTDAIAAGGRLWFIATAPCTPGGDDAVRDCVRLIEVGTGAGPTNVSLTSDRRFSEAGMDLYMGGVGRSTDGSIFVVYSRSSRTEVVSSWATWRLLAEDVFHDPSLIIPGVGPYSGTRWGDYVIVSPDPSAPDAVWQSNEVPSVDGSWFTWLSRLRPAPAGPLHGVVRVNGGDEFVAESFVELHLTNPTGVAATVVRVANDPAVQDGVLSGGQTMPIADDLPWSLDIDQPGDGARDGPRHVYVQWGDGRGHWSDVSTDSIILDTAPPTIGPVAPPQIAASTLGATGAVPITLRWGSGRDSLSGLEGYDAEVSRDDGDWDEFATTTVPAASGRVASGHVYTWRVRSFDRLGNVSEWRESVPVRVSVVDDASTSVHYSAGWRRSTTGSAYKGGVHVATRTGATATLTFSGRSFALVGTAGPGRGTLDVLVDGRRVGSFTEAAGSTRPSRIGFGATVPAGRHTVSIVATDGRPVDLDAVILLR